MTYQDTLDFLFVQTPMFQNLGAGAYKPGLGTTIALAEAFGNPHKKLKCIHVAGTNGKGSTAHTLAAVLQSAGYRTALYTSPHLVDFRERMRVDGNMISQEFVVDFVESYLANPALVALHPTFFELTTIMAFAWFASCNVDVAVIEVGLGGRLDSTNIIDPVLSIITNISLDHTNLLGHTEAEIAREKAGIIKPHVPVIIGESNPETTEVFDSVAEANDSEIYYAQENRLFDCAVFGKDYIDYFGTPWGTIRSELCGSYQPLNAATVFNAIRLLKSKFPKIDSEAVRNGFAHIATLTGLMGRWMEIRKNPRVICDTGHNPGGWQHLGPALKAIDNLSMVVGFVEDKDLESIISYMPRNARYYFCKPSVTRGRDADSTSLLFSKHGIEGQAYPTVRDAFMAAQSEASELGTIFVGGSTFVVADLLNALS